jgi:hypothetical protein
MFTHALPSSFRESATNSRCIRHASASTRIVLTNATRCLGLASRWIVPVLAIVGCVLLGNRWAQAQTVTFSPVNLSFGVPTGTTAVAPDPYPASAPESITVNIVGASPSTPVTFGATTITGSNLSDFIPAGDSCGGQTFTAAAVCQVALYFNASLAPATTLETATLTITPSTGNLVVPLSGAYGSIKLFGETNVATPPGSTGFTNLYTIATNTLNLSCPASPTATISGTPDGLGNPLVDNYLTLATGSPLTPVQGIESNYPPGNLCSGTGATSNSLGDDPYFNCFTESYELAASFNYPESVFGLDPDTFANSPNSVLASGNAGGIPPIPVSSFFTSGMQQDSFTLLSSGSATENYYANSTLFLSTSCSPGGLVPGGTITGNPTPVNNACFDSNTGANLCLLDNSAQNPPPSQTTPVFTHIAVPQQLFYELVAGTSAAVDVCFRMSSELDYSVCGAAGCPPNVPAPMCLGIEEQCWDPTHTTLNGANCDPANPTLLRDLYTSFMFDSPDGPLNGTNYLSSSSSPPNACSYYLTGGFAGGGISNGACASNTGPGVLMGADAWVCAPGSTGSSCTPLEPNMLTPPIFNTQTDPTTIIYSSSQSTNCALTGDVAGDLCPLDLLTQFLGEADNSPGVTKPAGNSVYIPVANHPLPSATAVVSNLQNGWVNGPAQVNFTASAAAYNPSSNNPFPTSPYNSFTPAPVYSVTYGLSPASSPLPDTTLPIATDQSVYPATSAQGFGHPLCSSGAPSYFAPPPVSVTPPSDGIYNLHYYTTDCALTEGLIFNPSNLSSPIVNWASFPYVTFGVDTQTPTFTCNTPPNPGVWYGTNQTTSCTVTENYQLGQYGSGFAPPVNGIQGSPSYGPVTLSTNVAPGSGSAAAPTNTVRVCNLAGTCVNVFETYMIDLSVPVVTGPTLNYGPYYVGTPITVTYSCSDAYSGIASCTATGGILSGGSFTPAAIGNYIFTVNATSNVGTTASNSVPYYVNQGISTVTFGPAPTPTYPGGSFTVSATTNSTAALSYSRVSGPCSLLSATAGTFTPTGTGVCVVKASVPNTTNYTAGSNTQNIIINSPSWTITPSSYSFPELSVGQSASWQFAVTNTVSVAASISVTIPEAGGENEQPGDPDDFKITSNGCGNTLAGGATCYVTVTFAADKDDPALPPPGNYAYLTVKSKGEILAESYMTDQVVDPTVSLSPTSYNFGSQTTGTPVTQEVATVTNQGPTTLIFGNLTMLGGGAFKLATGGGTNCTKDGTVAPGASCVIYVTFTPLKEGKAYSGTVTLNSNAANPPLTISLSGTGD